MPLSGLLIVIVALRRHRAWRCCRAASLPCGYVPQGVRQLSVSQPKSVRNDANGREPQIPVAQGFPPIHTGQ
jgi:hypothetical protein